MKKHGFRICIVPLLFFLFIACNPSSNSSAEDSSNAHNSDRSNTPEVGVDLPYTFKTEKAESLSVSAHDLAKRGKFKQAIGLYVKAIEIEENNPKLYFDIAESYSHIKAFPKAIAALDKAIALDSSNPHFYSNRGLNHYSLYHDEAAIADYKAAIMLDSTEGIYFVNLAITYNTVNRTTDACNAFKKAKSLGLDLNSYKVQIDIINLIKSCR